MSRNVRAYLEGRGARDLMARDRFQAVSSIEDARLSAVGASVDGGLGDPIVGARCHQPLGGSRWGLVYGFAVTENLRNYENTPDIGVSASVAWVSLRP
ncbi:MAG: hypothetical protein ACRD6R_12145 [Candidatus Polarisedimenticolia bacterium]